LSAGVTARTWATSTSLAISIRAEGLLQPIGVTAEIRNFGSIRSSSIPLGEYWQDGIPEGFDRRPARMFHDVLWRAPRLNAAFSGRITGGGADLVSPPRLRYISPSVGGV
jgi:hypothetical protein